MNANCEDAEIVPSACKHSKLCLDTRIWAGYLGQRPSVLGQPPDQVSFPDTMTCQTP